MKKSYIYTLFFLLLFWHDFSLKSQTFEYSNQDSLVKYSLSIEEVRVKAYENNRTIMEVPGTINLIDNMLISKTDEHSLVQSINTVPGIRMEQRSPSSYRISIRGSSTRSPFDVRNVKVYWNGAPFTDPSGITPLNLLDPSQVSSMEVLKGPAASIYGAGNGGVLLLNTDDITSDSSKLKGNISVGSYGLKRVLATYTNNSRSTDHLIQFSHTQSDGYREHTAMERTTIQYFQNYFTGEEKKWTLNVFASDLFYQVPGGLTLEQFNENPRQSRQPTAFFPGSIEQNSHVNYKAAFASLGYESLLHPNWKQTTVIYGRYSFFTMPFITDFEREIRQGWGGRTQIQFNSYLGNTRFAWLTGVEYQNELMAGRNFGNKGGRPDTLNFDDEVFSWQGLAFTKVEFEFIQNIFLDVSMSINNQQYDINRLYDAYLDTSFQRTKSFNPVFMPRIGLLKQIYNTMSVFASVSKGFSPPSVKEVRTGDGNLNTDLQPETGINYEFGYRTLFLQNKLKMELTFFDFSLSESIVSYTDSVSNVVKFRNSGATTQRGIEALVRWDILKQTGRFIENLSIQSAQTYHNFYFDVYIKDGNDFSGNALTGVAKHINTSVLSLGLKPGLYWHAITNYTDEIPLNDENSVFSDAFFVVNTKAGFNMKMNDYAIEVFAGINNLFDITYNLGNDLNAYGGRYFQPAPGRNYYIGLQIKAF